MLLDAKSDSPVSLLDPVHRPCEKNKLDKSFSHSQTIWWHNGGMRIFIVTNIFTVQQSLSSDRIIKAKLRSWQSWGPITNGLVVVVIGLKSNYMLGRPIQNIFFSPFLSLCLMFWFLWKKSAKQYLTGSLYWLYGLFGPFLTLFNAKNIIFSPFREKIPGKA